MTCPERQRFCIALNELDALTQASIRYFAPANLQHLRRNIADHRLCFRPVMRA